MRSRRRISATTLGDAGGGEATLEHRNSRPTAATSGAAGHHQAAAVQPAMAAGAELAARISALLAARGRDRRCDAGGIPTAGGHRRRVARQPAAGGWTLCLFVFRARV